MNVFIHQGRAVPDEVRNASIVVKPYLENKNIRNIAQEVNLSYQTVSNIVDLWIETGFVENERARKGRTDDVISFIEYLKQKNNHLFMEKKYNSKLYTVFQRMYRVFHQSVQFQRVILDIRISK